MSRHTARAILFIGLLLAFVTACSPWPVCGARSHVQCHHAGSCTARVFTGIHETVREPCDTLKRGANDGLHPAVVWPVR